MITIDRKSKRIELAVDLAVIVRPLGQGDHARGLAVIGKHQPLSGIVGTELAPGEVNRIGLTILSDPESVDVIVGLVERNVVSVEGLTVLEENGQRAATVLDFAHAPELLGHVFTVFGKLMANSSLSVPDRKN